MFARALVPLVLSLAVGGCAGEPDAPHRSPSSANTPSLRLTATPGSPSAATAPAADVQVVTIYDGALGQGWNDYGWAPRDLGKGPARLDLSNHGGWIIAHPGLGGRYGALVLDVSAPAQYGDFLEVRLASERQDAFPAAPVRRADATALPGGWIRVVVPIRTLNPDNLEFDRVLIRAQKAVGSERVSVDKIELTVRAEPDAPPAFPVNDVALSIRCLGTAMPVSPLIYGIAYDPMHDAGTTHQWKLGATARRWGGNPASRYNWEMGNAWSTAMDWFFENVNYTGNPSFTYADFLKADLDHGVSTALTVPILGWVAKDTTSYGFPVSLYGAQQAADPGKPDAGNGRTASGKPLPSGPPTRTSVAAPPEMIRRWVEQIRAADRKRGGRSVQMYILDNEPMLWNSTHRDVHPEPVTYDELLDRTLRYGAAVRAADPDAVIAGPALWGWPAYFFSAKDAAEGFQNKPDRLAHGDVPFLAWYLQKLRAHEQKTGTRVLDVVDVHFYPQAERVFGANGGTDAATAARRIRSTRALWDVSYTDESWIADKVQLIPRMQEIIAQNYPGLGLSIGEYNFGAETHISGGLALAEALGRFATHGVTAAFYWTYPPDRSPAFWAFRAYRDFDGKGGRFLDKALPTRMTDGVSLFASRDGESRHIVAILLNLRPDRAIRAKVALDGCQATTSQQGFQYAGGEGGFTSVPVTAEAGGVTTGELRPYSIAVLDIHLGDRP